MTLLWPEMLWLSLAVPAIIVAYLLVIVTFFIVINLIVPGDSVGAIIQLLGGGAAILQRQA